jgi:hypothetical protein
MVAAYLSSSVGLVARTFEVVDSTNVWLDTVIVLENGGSVLRGRRVLSSGMPRLLVGVIDGRVYRLGGFPDPEPSKFWASVPPGLRHQNPRERATILARVLDPHGAASIRFLDQDSANPARTDPLRIWWTEAPVTWPSDTIVVDADGGFRVRVTALSEMDPEETPGAWMPIAYSFRFNRLGDLTSWAQRVGSPIIVR